jgi:hypothetical protein
MVENSESDAASDAAVALHVAGGCDRDGGLHRQAVLAGKGRDVWEMIVESVP